MSRENVGIVRRGYEAVNRGDLETVRALVADDFELHSIFAPGRVFHGRDAIRDVYTEIGEALAGYEQIVEELIDAGDQVVAVIRLVAAGQGSGVEVTQRFATVWSLRGGKAEKAVTYPARDEALEAVGLSE